MLILTIEQTLSFIKDDTTIANTDGLDFVESDVKQVGSDEAMYTLVIKKDGKFFQGRVQYYDAGGTFSCGDLTHKPGFYDTFRGLEMIEVRKVPKTVEVWEPVK